MKNKSNTDKKVFVVIIGIIVGVFIFISRINNKCFYYDASNYWTLGQSFWDKKGSFSLYNFPQNIRGYFLPILLGFLEKSGIALFHNEYVLWRVFYSISLVVTLTVVFPKLLGVKCTTRRWTAGSIISVVLFMVFWKDLVTYPLSDLISLMFYLMVILILRSNLALGKGKSQLYSIGMVIIAGGLAYAAYNIRTVYLVPLAIVVIVWIVLKTTKEQIKIIPSILALLTGITLLAIPQMLINHYYYNSYSPNVVTASYGQDSLFVAQLEMGTAIPRYETFIGSTEEYPAAGIKYYNEAGKRIAGETSIASIRDFVMRAFHHPIETMGIYFEHLISGMTLFYDELYVSDISVNWKIFVSNMLLYVLAFLGIIAYRKRISGKMYGTITMIILPAVLALPGAVETRFFLPVYILVYVFVTMIMDYRLVWSVIRKNAISLSVLVVCVVMIWCMTATNLLCSLEYGQLGFNGQRYITQIQSQ